MQLVALLDDLQIDIAIAKTIETGHIGEGAADGAERKEVERIPGFGNEVVEQVDLEGSGEGCQSGDIDLVVAVVDVRVPGARSQAAELNDEGVARALRVSVEVVDARRIAGGVEAGILEIDY